MASITTNATGIKRLLFTDRDGNRKEIRIGRVPDARAQSFKQHCEQLIQAHCYGDGIKPATAKWLHDLPEKMHKRIAGTGIIGQRGSLALGAWLDKFMAGKAGLKPGSREKLEQTKAKLLDFFDRDDSIRGITPDAASDWRQSLVDKGLSDASVKIHTGNVKGFFNEAVRRELLTRNPFEHLASGSTASECDHYVTPDEAEKVIEALPNAEWRLLFGLARYAGLRVPSESHLLTPADVGWTTGRLNVKSPKTERHRGKERRCVPIVPRLMKLLQDRYDELPEGQEQLITIRGEGCVRHRFERVLKACEIQPWPRLWQTLRCSCEKQWALTYPQHAVSRWIGHSITVSGKHYLGEVTAELFEKVTGKATQKAPQHNAEQPGTMEKAQ